MQRSNPPLSPRNGRVLQVLAICRIRTLNQDEQSLEDQEAMYRKWIAEHYGDKVEFQVIKTQGSGEWLDRDEIAEAKRRIETRTIDLVIAEDLGRVMRDLDAVKFCGFAEDFDTRVIAINDQVDTAEDGWDDRALMSAWSHAKNNEQPLPVPLFNRRSHAGECRLRLDQRVGLFYGLTAAPRRCRHALPARNSRPIEQPANVEVSGSGAGVMTTSPMSTVPLPLGTFVKNCVEKLLSNQVVASAPSTAYIPNDPDAPGEARKSTCNKFDPGFPGTEAPRPVTKKSFALNWFPVFIAKMPRPLLPKR
ncbi:MAG TPA: recombinase family protein [Tepidisphaeraceae bacterium]|nr:recombinase family protein [Tepidisphaeraceae bacterium]